MNDIIMLPRKLNSFEKFIATIICCVLGHKPYTTSWKNFYSITWNRKGGKRRNAGSRIYSTRHYRVYCSRCGKLLKKK